MAQSYTRSQVCAASGVEPHTLDYWRRVIDDVGPSVKPANGAGFAGLWSTIDVSAIAAIGHVFRDFRKFGAQMPNELVADIWRRVHADEWPVRVEHGTLTITTPPPSATSVRLVKPSTVLKRLARDVPRVQPMCVALDEHRPELILAMQSIFQMLNEEKSA